MTKQNNKRKTNINNNMIGIIHYKDIKSYAKDLFVSHNFVLYSLFYSDKFFIREYNLRIWQRLFIMIDEPRSCRFALLWNLIIICVTFISCTVYILSTLQQFKISPLSCTFPVCSYDINLCPNNIICEPETPIIFQTMETVCVIIFSCDYFLRVLTSATVPARIAGMIFDDFTEKELIELNIQFTDNKQIKDFDKKYPWYIQMIVYAIKPLNLIDLIAILPYYVSLNGQLITKRNNLTVLRIFRLGRVFRLIKAVKNTVGVQLIMRTLMRAVDALSILIFLSGIGVVVIGSLMEFIEEGTYAVDSVVPHGSYVRNDLLGNEEESPFLSIPVSLYYSVVTMCTVGYGDIYPTTIGGRFLACLFMYCGVLIFAFPISVLGNNFDRLCDETKGGAAELVATSMCELMDTDFQDDENVFVNQQYLDNDLINDELLLNTLAANHVQVLIKLATQQARKLCGIAIISKGLMDPASSNSRKLNLYLEELGLEKIIAAIEDPDFEWEDNVRNLFFPEKNIQDTRAVEALGKVSADSHISPSIKRHTRNSLVHLYHTVKPKISSTEKIVRKSIKLKRKSLGLNAFGRITSDDEEITADMLNPNEKVTSRQSMI
jgi:hypothetical protein